MPVTIEPYTSKKALIEKITSPGSISAFSSCLKHQWKGTAFGGVLWCLFENPNIISAFHVKSDPKSNGWSWERFDEKDHPLFVSCPKSWLKLVPPTCPAWRDKVDLAWSGIPGAKKPRVGAKRPGA